MAKHKLFNTEPIYVFHIVMLVVILALSTHFIFNNTRNYWLVIPSLSTIAYFYDNLFHHYIGGD